MSKTARQGASGYRPSCRQCVECKHAADDCRGIDFAALPQAGKIDKDGVQRVRCMFYEREVAEGSSVTHPCPECGGRGWHKLSCSQRTDRAPQYPATRDAGGVVTVCQRACGRCHSCAPNKIGGQVRMIVCPECGNKRCPHATDHRNACTGSNEPGQPGSAYPAVPTLDEVRATLGAYEAAQEAWRSMPPFVQCLPCAEFDADATCPQCPGRADHVEDLRAMVPCSVCAVGHATLQRDDAGYYRACDACGSDYAGADELALRRGHVVDADKMVRPCRTCGPDGCADSVSCPRLSP